MKLDIQRFKDIDDDFFDHGLEEAGLEDRIEVEQLKQWFDSSYPSSDSITEVYWIEPPFSFASISIDDDLLYQVHEVNQQDTDVRRFIMDSIGKDLSNVEVEYDELFDACNSIMRMIKDEELSVDNYADMYHARRESSGFMQLYPYVEDGLVEDISYSGSEPGFISHRNYRNIPCLLDIPRIESSEFVEELLGNFNRSTSDKMIHESLTENTFLQATIGSEKRKMETTFTLRVFSPISFTPIDLYDSGTYSSRMLAYLWMAVENNMSILVAGGTASGKTSTIEALLHFSPKHAKVVTVENRRQISIPHQNWVASSELDEVDGEEISIYDMTRAAVRQRPEYLAVDEIRGQEAESAFQAMNTGHTVLSTIHSDTMYAAIDRLTNPPINIPKKLVTALDIVCLQSNYPTILNNNNRNTKRADEIREIVNLRDNGQFENRRPFQWDSESDEFTESLEDSYAQKRLINQNLVEDFEKEIDQRSTVIEALSNGNIDNSEDVYEIISMYHNNQRKVVDHIESEELGKLISD